MMTKFLNSDQAKKESEIGLEERIEYLEDQVHGLLALLEEATAENLQLKLVLKIKDRANERRNPDHRDLADQSTGQ